MGQTGCFPPRLSPRPAHRTLLSATSLPGATCLHHTAPGLVHAIPPPPRARWHLAIAHRTSCRLQSVFLRVCAVVLLPFLGKPGVEQHLLPGDVTRVRAHQPPRQTDRLGHLALHRDAPRAGLVGVCGGAV